MSSRRVAEELIPTRSSLLVRIKDLKDDASWREFHDTYQRLIYGVARKTGLNEVEAEDAAQDTLVAVAQHIREFRYEPKSCSFKSWLLMITRQRIIWQIRRRKPNQTARPFRSDCMGKSDEGWTPTFSDEETSRTSTIDRLPDAKTLNIDAVWDEEWRKGLLTLGLERVKAKVSERQFQIFELATVQEWSVSDIARTLSINAARVYLARHRVGAVLKREVRELAKKFSQS